VRQYSDEKARIWEDVKHGLIYGSQDFMEELKTRFLKNRPEAELPQHNRLLRDIDPDNILKSASSLMNCDPSIFFKPGRLPADIRKKRDMLIFYLWKNSGMGNRQIGEVFALTYSSVSKIVVNFREQYKSNCELEKKYKTLIAKFKV